MHRSATDITDLWPDGNISDQTMVFIGYHGISFSHISLVVTIRAFPMQTDMSLLRCVLLVLVAELGHTIYTTQCVHSTKKDTTMHKGMN